MPEGKEERHRACVHRVHMDAMEVEVKVFFWCLIVVSLFSVTDAPNVDGTGIQACVPLLHWKMETHPI
jgi:hypothetical protein